MLLFLDTMSYQKLFKRSVAGFLGKSNCVDVIMRHPWFDSALSWLFSYCNQYAPWDYLRNNTENGFLQICLLDRWTLSRNHIANPRGLGKVVSGLLVKINSSAGYKCRWLGEEKKYLFKENRGWKWNGVIEHVPVWVRAIRRGVKPSSKGSLTCPMSLLNPHLPQLWVSPQFLEGLVEAAPQRPQRHWQSYP